MISFQVECFSIVKRRANSTIEQKECKGHGKVIDFQFRKRKSVIRFPSVIKVLSIDPVFSNWCNFNQKVLNCYRNSNSFKAIYLFLRNSKVEGF